MKKMLTDDIKEKFKKGMKIELIEMVEEEDMSAGLKGVVDYVDDIGSIHVIWGNYRNLALICGLDKFKVVN